MTDDEWKAFMRALTCERFGETVPEWSRVRDKEAEERERTVPVLRVVRDGRGAA